MKINLLGAKKPDGESSPEEGERYDGEHTPIARVEMHSETQSTARPAELPIFFEGS